MEMTNAQKHYYFKREISASLIESASWNDRQLEDYKTISMQDFWYDYIGEDGFLYDCMDANKDFLMGKANEFEEDFNVIRNTLWYGGIIKMVYEENAKLDMHDCYDYLNEEVTEYCIECDTEVELKTELRMQVCPSCGKPIAPCSICDMDFVKCSQCPIGCNSLVR